MRTRSWVLPLLAASTGLLAPPPDTPAQGGGSDRLGVVRYVDPTVRILCSAYAVATRDCSGRDGPAYRSIEGAVRAADPGDVVLIRGGVYALPARGQIVLDRSGTPDRPIRVEGYGTEQVVIRGVGFEDRDLDGDGFADGPKDHGDRSALVRVTGHHLVIRRIVVEQAPHFGILVQGDHNLLEEVRVGHGWMSNVVIVGSHNRLRHVQTHHSRHGSGVLLTAPKGGREVLDNEIARSLSHDNGRDADGAQVLRIKGDPAGGGNSDGMGSHKTCHDGLPAIVCRNLRFVDNIAWRNVDDGFDVTLADSRLVGNVAIDNGPTGRRGFKGLRFGSGNLYSGNVAVANHLRGFEPRGQDSLDFFHNLGIRNAEKAVAADTRGEARGRYYNNVSYLNEREDFFWSGGEEADNWAARKKGDPHLANASAAIDFRLPDGTVEARWRFLMDQVVVAFTPAAGSPLLDAGRLIPGFHCATADDDPGTPMDPAAPCRHWAGAAPDIGPFEFGLRASRDGDPRPWP